MDELTVRQSSMKLYTYCAPQATPAATSTLHQPEGSAPRTKNPAMNPTQGVGCVSSGLSMSASYDERYAGPRKPVNAFVTLPTPIPLKTPGFTPCIRNPFGVSSLSGLPRTDLRPSFNSAEAAGTGRGIAQQWPSYHSNGQTDTPERAGGLSATGPLLRTAELGSALKRTRTYRTVAATQRSPAPSRGLSRATSRCSIRHYPQRPGHTGLSKESGKRATWYSVNQAGSSSGRNDHGTQLSQGMGVVSLLRRVRA